MFYIPINTKAACFISEMFFTAKLLSMVLKKLNLTLQCGPMPNMMATLANIGGAFCSTLQVWLTPTTRVPCSNTAKTWSLLKLAGVPLTSEPISAASQPSSPYCKDTWGRYCCSTSFFLIVDTCLSCEDIADKVVQSCPDGEFLAIFSVLYFQWAACSTFQTCIVNSH